jgi:uncharacterized protein with NAD-binding domain and iron-sulfur cluster
MKKIAILGGGVGGLSTATELLKYGNYNITIFERNSGLGGQARSKITPDSVHSEYCFHAVGSGYIHFLNLMNTITDSKGVKLIASLRPINNYIYALNNSIYNDTENIICKDLQETVKRIYNKNLTWWDTFILYKIVLTAYFCNTIQYDSVLWSDFTSGCSPELKRILVDSTSIFLGMDYSKLSTHTMLELIRRNKKSNLLLTDNFYSFDGPMNTVLFDNWQRYLETRGVIIHLNTEIVDINIHKGKIQHIETADKKFMKFDAYVNSMDIEALSKLCPAPKFIELNEKSRQVQTQVIFYLETRLQPSYMGPSIVTMIDTPWFLMFRIEGDLWDLQKMDIISVGIGMWDVPGIIYNKSALNCNREEIAHECWAQIHSGCHNLKLPKKIPNWNIWDSFKYDGNVIDTYEPKFSNNINTFQLRPNNVDDNIVNLFHSTAYVKTETNLFNMESAVEAGNKTAKIISQIDLLI